MANLALVSATPANAIRPDYNPALAISANPAIQWPSGGGAHMRERAFVPIVSPISIAAGGGLTTGKPIVG